jgi:hypothetical protein
MFKRMILITVFSGLLFLAAGARIRHVPGEYSTIQEGINDCSGGDTLLVDPGVYYENISFNGQYLVLASKLIISGNQAYIDSTVINGGAQGAVVRFESGEDSRAVITGFTITNGYSDNGGGIRSVYSSPVISYNRITGNTTFSGLWPYGQGAGIYCDHSQATILNNVIAGNVATGTDGGRGGGLFCQYSTPDLINNTFYGNQAMWFGGAICLVFSSPMITGCILWGNIANEGPEIFIDEGNPVITYSDIYAGWQGQGNINSNPEFRDRPGGDLHLMSTFYGFPYNSPCIDAGAPYIRDFALDSLWGLGTVLADMGAYGGGDFELAGIEDDIARVPSRITVKGNYPNPFNNKTVIKFDLAEPGDVSVDIFDILGRHVETLIDANLPCG